MTQEFIYPFMDEVAPDGMKFGEALFLSKRRALETKNKMYRAKLLVKAKDDPRLQKAIMKACKADVRFFFNVMLWTYNPRLADDGYGTGHIPFITYNYQDDFLLDLVDSVENKKDTFIEKSRDMGFSWCLVGFQLWGFMCKDWASLYGTYKESYLDVEGDMDSHFERLRYCIRKLPAWFKPSDLSMKNKTISSRSKGISITGDIGENFGTGGRRKFVVMDEFALWQADKKVWRKTRDVTNCRIVGGTPEGKFNVYGKVMTDHPDYEKLAIKKIRLHWNLHPMKDQAWYDSQKLRATALDIAKELDISYETSVSGAVYPTWARAVRLGDFKYSVQGNKVLLSITDYGRDGVATIFVQKDLDTGRSAVVDCFCELRTEKVIAHFASLILGVADPEFQYDADEHEIIDRHRGWKYLKHVGDPYNGKAKHIANQSSVFLEWKKKGIYLDLEMEFPKSGSHVQDRIQKATMLLPMLDVDRTHASEFYEFVQQAHYPREKEGHESTTERVLPVHDDTSHYRTAFEYYAAIEGKIKAPKPKVSKKEHEKKFAEWRI